MKTMLMTRAAITVLGLTLCLSGAGLALGDDQPSGVADQTGKVDTYKGSVVAVDSQERSITVRGHLTTRTFNANDTCKVALEDKPRATLADLSAGQKVTISYQWVHGVLVAQEVVQENLAFKGHVTALDPAKRTIAVKRGVFTRSFTLTDGHMVLVKDDKAGSLESLRIGDTVTVVYQSESEPLMAHRVEQKNPTFTGTIRAIDARTRTVTARNLMGEKKFHLANGCKIVVDGRINAGLADLRIGDRMSVSYEDANGVLVANRIGRESGAADSDRSETASSVTRPAFP